MNKVYCRECVFYRYYPPNKFGIGSSRLCKNEEARIDTPTHKAWADPEEQNNDNHCEYYKVLTDEIREERKREERKESCLFLLGFLVLFLAVGLFVMGMMWILNTVIS
jgi:hypothetical protein